MLDAKEDRIIADMRRRLLHRSLLNVAVSLAAAGGVVFFGLRMGAFSSPHGWTAIAALSGLALPLCGVGMIGAWWLTRLPAEALTPQIALRQSDRSQRTLSRIFIFFPLIMGVLGLVASALVVRIVNHGWQPAEIVFGVGLLAGAATYLLILTGWGSAKRTGLIYNEELFSSFRTRGYIAGFWSVMAGLPLILALGLARLSWAVEALPLLMAVGVSVPAVTIALLNREAERDA